MRRNYHGLIVPLLAIGVVIALIFAVDLVVDLIRWLA
jgi:hypothetical protein